MSDFTNEVFYYFFVITTVTWISLYTVLSFFGNTLTDIPSNGNSVVQLMIDITSWIIAALNTLTANQFPEAFSDLFYILKDVISVWFVVPQIVFYIFFIPMAIATILFVAGLFGTN